MASPHDHELASRRSRPPPLSRRQDARLRGGGGTALGGDLRADHHGRRRRDPQCPRSPRSRGRRPRPAWARNALAAALLGALGVGIGSLLRNQAVAIVGILLLAFVVEPVLLGVASNVARFGPFIALPTAIVTDDPTSNGFDPGELLGRWAAVGPRCWPGSPSSSPAAWLCCSSGTSSSGPHALWLSALLRTALSTIGSPGLGLSRCPGHGGEGADPEPLPEGPASGAGADRALSPPSAEPWRASGRRRTLGPARPARCGR